MLRGHGQHGIEVALFSRDFMKSIKGVKDHGAIDVLDIDSKPTGMAGKVAFATSDIAASREAARR